MPSKSELRRLMRTRLGRMNPAAMAVAAEGTQKSIPCLPRWQAARIVAAYVALPDEPDLQPLEWAASKKTVLLPRVQGRDLVFHAVENIAQLRPGAFGIMEPDPAQCLDVDPRRADIIFVPGVAFTSGGERLGRGGGYYDRLLGILPEAILRVGVCFPCQMVDELPTEPHDQAVDIVITSPD